GRNYACDESYLLDRCFSEFVSLKPGNPEVTAQMQHIDWAEISRHSDQGEALRSFGENNGAANIDTVKHEPDIGGSVVKFATMRRSRDQMLPSPQVVGIANGFYLSFISNARGAEAQQVHTDSVEPVDRMAGRLVVIGNHARSNTEQSPVEGKAVLDSCLQTQFGQCRRCP